MAKVVIFECLLIAVCFLHETCYAGPVTALKSSVETERGEHALMQWRVEGKDEKGVQLSTIIVTFEVNGEKTTIANGGLEKVFINPVGEKTFSKRMIASVKDNVLSVRLANTKDSDERTFVVTGVYDTGVYKSAVKLTIENPSSGPLGSGSTTSNIAIIAGAVVGGILVLLIIIALCVYCMRRRRNDMDYEDEEDDESSVMRKRSGEGDIEMREQAGNQTNEYAQFILPPKPARNKPQKSVYSELGPGGRTGPKSIVTQSQYAEVRS